MAFIDDPREYVYRMQQQMEAERRQMHEEMKRMKNQMFSDYGMQQMAPAPYVEAKPKKEKPQYLNPKLLIVGA